MCMIGAGGGMVVAIEGWGSRTDRQDVWRDLYPFAYSFRCSKKVQGVSWFAIWL